MKKLLYAIGLLVILSGTMLPGGKNRDGILLSPSINISNVVAAAGTNVSVPVKVQGLSNIGAISLKIPYNSALTFTSISTTTSLSFISNASGGVISIAWVDFTGMSPQTFPDGSALLNLNFTYNGGSAPITFNTPLCQFADEQAVPIPVSFNNGGVTPFTGNFPTLSIGNTTALNNTSVILPLNAQTFNSINSFTVKITYNTSLLTYIGLSNTYNGITISNNAASGVLTLSWTDPTGTTPITISNGLLANLKFTYLTGSGPIGFNAVLSEVINSSGQIISGVIYTNGSIAQAVPPAAPVLNSPLTGAVNQPVALTLSWGSVATAQSYRVQISTDSLFVTTNKDSSGIMATSLNVTSLNKNAKYYWRVNASYLGLAGNYSTVSNFKTIPLPTVSGKVLYASTVPQGVKNVIVTLNPGGFSTTTDNSGSFNFMNVPNGSYTMTATTANPWMNNEINSTDALWIAQYYVGLRTFSDIQNLSADVSLQGGVNNTDALLIVRRWAGLTSSFTSSDWVFTYPAVTVADSNINLNINSLMSGDVNASSNMSAILKQSFITFEQKALLKIKQNEEFDIPVTINQNVNLGAMNLSFNYPSELASFDGITSTIENIITNGKNGNVKIAWVDISGGKNPYSLKSGSNILVLRFKPTSAFKPDSRFSLQFDQSLCEFASVDGNILPSVQLQLPSVSLAGPSEFSLLQNYPNPFNPSTTIKYVLASESSVTLKIFNSLGQSVHEFNEGTKKEGNYDINFNAAGLASGIYMFAISAQSTDGKNNFTAVKKMILMK